MMEISKCMKIPKIRFKGFEEEWNIAKIKEIAKFSKGNGYSKADLTQQGTPIILYGHMYTQYKSVITSVNHYVKIKPNSVLSDGNEVIIPSSGETPEDISIASAICKSNIIIGGDLNILRFNDEILNKSFAAISISYSKTHKELSRYAQGKTIVHLRNNDIAKGHITYPSLNEQRLIVLFIETIETQIQATSKKLASLKQIKAASLQSMFPQEGETVPKVRFKGFEGEWDFVTAGEVFRTTNVRNRPDLPVLSATQDKGMVKRSDIGYQVFHDKSNETTYKHILPGQFIIHLRSFQGGFAHSNIEGIVSPAYTVMEFKNKEFHYDYFWKYIFTSKGFIKRLELITYGIRDGRTISFDEFKEMNFFIPSKLEQQKIASYFCNLDKQISLQTQRLEKLKQIKAACLDKMFV